MKKLMIAAAIVCAAALSQAASVGWSWGGVSTAAKNNAYDFFVIGQNGVTSVAQITALIEAGTDVSDYAFGSGLANANGSVNVSTSASGKTIDIAGDTSFEAFFVIFNTPSQLGSVDPEIAKATQYLTITKDQSPTGLYKTANTKTTALNFAAGNQASYIDTASNWKNVPEPTSGLLLLLGVAGLALRRKQK